MVVSSFSFITISTARFDRKIATRLNVHSHVRMHGCMMNLGLFNPKGVECIGETVKKSKITL
jgi:hypothetical protein